MLHLPFSNSLPPRISAVHQRVQRFVICMRLAETLYDLIRLPRIFLRYIYEQKLRRPFIDVII